MVSRFNVGDPAAGRWGRGRSWRKRQDSNLRDLPVCPVSTGVPSAARPRFRWGVVWEECRARQESNLQPSAPEADALSIDLRARVLGIWWVGVDSNRLSRRQRFYRPPQLAVSVAHPKGVCWCARGDLNSHGLCRRGLSPVRLPFRHVRIYSFLEISGISHALPLVRAERLELPWSLRATRS